MTETRSDKHFLLVLDSASHNKRKSTSAGIQPTDSTRVAPYHLVEERCASKSKVVVLLSLVADETVLATCTPHPSVFYFSDKEVSYSANFR